MNRTISYEQYKQTVMAGWLGKCLGGVIGAPLENHKQYHSLTLDTIWPDEIGANDDLDIQMIWLEAMEDYGVHLSSDDMVKIWQERCFYNYLDYGYFLYNVQRGIDPPLSGTWNNHFFHESEGCPIRSEIWGFIAPGNMQLAAQMAKQDGELDHGGLSVEIEMFQAALAAESFFCNDIILLLDVAQEVLPVDSSIPSVIARVKEINAQYTEHRQAWQVLIREFGHRDASKAITNFAIVLLALLKGGGDFKKTILYCVNSGWDVDCTTATAGAILGTVNGLESLPSEWSDKLSDKLICAIKRRFDGVPLTEVADVTCRIGVEMMKERNLTLEITGAPEVKIRPAPEPAVAIRADYPDQPVLWSKNSTKVNLIIDNPFDYSIAGHLAISSPDGVICKPEFQNITLEAKTQVVVPLTIRRKTKSPWLADTNLFKARFSSNDCSINKVFGLSGARQWQVYGPYWEMWDRTKNLECPYHNNERKCHPGHVGCGSDSYNNYVRLDYQYLDEKKLITKDIPSEVPLYLEAPEDWITEQHLGGFNGQACYYFVRTFQTPSELKEAILGIGRTGPYRVWLNGEDLGEQTDTKDWTPWEQENILQMNFKGQTQRLVVKILRTHEAMTFSTSFFGEGDPENKRGISWFHDSFSDIVVPYSLPEKHIKHKSVKLNPLAKKSQETVVLAI